MIKLSDVKKENQQILDTDWSKFEGTESRKKAAQTKAKKRLKFLRLMIIYLEGNPSADFVKNELQKLQDKIELINTHFSWDGANANNSTFLEYRKKFDNEWGIPKFKEQIKVLKYLLKK